MRFWSLLVVAATPCLQVLLIASVGALLASRHSNILKPDAIRDINKVVYVVFGPSLMVASLAKTVTLHNLISWWFMPVNIGITFLIGGILGWIVVKILKPEQHLEGLIIASCSAGNLGYMPLMIIRPICNEDRSPFGDSSSCRDRGLSYVSLSMALGGIYIWTYTYSLMQKSGILYQKIRTIDGSSNMQSSSTLLLKEEQLSCPETSIWGNLQGTFHQIAEKLITPPMIASICGFIIGTAPWLKSLLIGDTAPLRVIQDSMKLLGDGLLPCSTLILGGNLTQGLHRQKLRSSTIVAIVAVRYVVLPVAGIGVVKAAGRLGLLPEDPLFAYLLLLQFTLPPAVSIGTMAQLFDVCQEESSVILLWTYIVAALAITTWLTVFMWILF